MFLKVCPEIFHGILIIFLSFDKVSWNIILHVREFSYFMGSDCKIKILCSNFYVYIFLYICIKFLFKIGHAMVGDVWNTANHCWYEILTEQVNSFWSGMRHKRKGRGFLYIGFLPLHLSGLAILIWASFKFFHGLANAASATRRKKINM